MFNLLADIEDSVIVLYQKWLSRFIGNQCKYYPTCSEYARQSLRKDSLLKANLKIVWRILRCNPWARGGEDQP